MPQLPSRTIYVECADGTRVDCSVGDLNLAPGAGIDWPPDSVYQQVRQSSRYNCVGLVFAGRRGRIPAETQTRSSGVVTIFPGAMATDLPDDEPLILSKFGPMPEFLHNLTAVEGTYGRVHSIWRMSA